MNKRYLLSFDFDGTIAETFKKGPRGIGVNEATNNAITDIFGKPGAIQFDRLGGLKNRAPSELINLILKSDKEGFTRNAQKIFENNAANLSALIPSTKGVPLVWDEKNAEQLIGELFVRQKLSYLLEQVGEKTADGQLWPPLTQGFLEFWGTLQKLKEEGIPLDTAIISSGHDIFIDKVFELYNLAKPDIIVSEDDIRGRKYPKEIERRVKPGELPLALTHFRWLKAQGMDYFNFDLKSAKEVRERMIYFGDDPNKDGKLAEGAKINFGFFVPGNLFLMEKDNFSAFKDWKTIGELLNGNKEMFSKGESFNRILKTEGSVGGPEIK